MSVAGAGAGAQVEPSRRGPPPERSLHVLLAGFGTRGDVQPLLALARGLVARGHTATVAGPPDFAAWAASLGVAYAPVGEGIGAFLRRVSSPRGELVPRRAMRAMPGWLRSHYAPLLPLAEVADVVVAASLTVAPLDLAEKLGKRAHYVAYCPQALPSSEHPIAFVTNHRLPGWLNRLSFRLGALGHDLGVRAHVDDERRKLGLGKSGETWDHILYRNLVLASEPAIAPLPRDLRPGRWVLQPGAFFLDTGEPLDEVVTAFLSRGPAPVYVGFGSMPDVDPAATREWVARAAREAGVRVIWLGPEPSEDDWVLTITEANHQALFPRCAAAVHHGGAGTGAAAARAGLPQAIAPHVTDQWYWADRFARLGVLGPRVDPRARRGPALARALRAVTTEPGLRERARALGAAIRGDGVARMVDALERPLARGQ